jgi:hypothetical protein
MRARKPDSASFVASLIVEATATGPAASVFALGDQHGEARLLEIDHRYCDHSSRQEWSGEKAYNEEGQSFEEVSNGRVEAVAVG